MSPTKKGSKGGVTTAKGEDWRAKCTCERCPTYTDCSLQKAELLFCMTARTECKVEERGCICPTCPVHRANDFLKKYYCINGTETEQRKL